MSELNPVGSDDTHVQPLPQEGDSLASTDAIIRAQVAVSQQLNVSSAASVPAVINGAQIGEATKEQQNGEVARAETAETAPAQVREVISTQVRHRRSKIALEVGIIALTVIFSPILLIGGAIAAGVVHAKSDGGLKQAAIRAALLPASSRSKSRRDRTIDREQTYQKVKVDGGELDVKIRLPLGVSNDLLPHLPVVVVFNQNNAMMEDYDMRSLAEDFNENSCVVVQFDYRGVGESTGKITSATDLVADGEAVVNRLLGEGFEVEGRNTTIQPEPSQVRLYGSSIGGAVAIGVGAQHPEIPLLANHTFTTWQDAAKGSVREAGPFYLAGKLAKWAAGKIANEETNLDNVTRLNERLSSGEHSVTVIETVEGDAGQGDGVLSKKAQLRSASLSTPLEGELFEATQLSAELSADGEVPHNVQGEIADRGEVMTRFLGTPGNLVSISNRTRLANEGLQRFHRGAKITNVLKRGEEGANAAVGKKLTNDDDAEAFMDNMDTMLAAFRTTVEDPARELNNQIARSELDKFPKAIREQMNAQAEAAVAAAEQALVTFNHYATTMEVQGLSPGGKRELDVSLQQLKTSLQSASNNWADIRDLTAS